MDSNGVNEWSTASLNTYLNGTYYNGLSESAQSMIGNTKYYLGGRKWDSNTHYGSTEDMYDWERGTVVFEPSTNQIPCNYTVTQNGMCVIRTINWTGKVALLYPSDYGYTYANGVEKECFDDPYMCYEKEATPSNESVNNHPEAGWIYSSNIKGIGDSYYTWFLSPYAGTSNHYDFVAFGVQSSGYVDSDYDVDYSRGIRPVVYLTSDVKITSGEGTSSNPYTLSK